MCERCCKPEKVKPEKTPRIKAIELPLISFTASGKNERLAREQLLGGWEMISGRHRSSRHETLG
jgi:hypothetical protein